MQNTAVAKVLNSTWKKVETLLSNKGFKTVLLESDKSIRKFIYDNIPDKAVVGLGSSICSSALKIRDILLEKGNQVYYYWNGNNYNRSLDSFDELPDPDYYITTADNITEEGNVINSEYSRHNSIENIYPKNIIAFTEANNISKKSDKSKITADYIIIDHKPESTNFTVAVTNYVKAS